MSVDDHQRIVADYLAGHDVADIGRRYDVTQAEIEWLVAQQRKVAHAGTELDRPRRPVLPVLIAAVLLAAVAALLLGVVVVLLLSSADVALLALTLFLPSAILLSAAYGLWRGWRGSQVIAIVIGVLLLLSGLSSSDSIALGVVMVAVGAAVSTLVVAPPSARAWFSGRSVSAPRPRSRPR